ncbi:MAG: trehalose-phosphatase [Burkholderiales bacterium]|nr:trehalose-phosphatase [Burkholderiales bacterium]
MPHLLQPQGEAVLAAALRRSPLLAFDFDGTLARIAPTPARARISRSVSGKLRRLCERLPVAIVTGRSVADVRGRLDFEPRYVAGNHGAEIGPAQAPGLAGELDLARDLLRRHAADLARAGITLEDKGLSLALHYRLARCPEQARAVLREVLQPLHGDYRIFSGRQVENVAPRDAADKRSAVHHLVRQCRADCAIFIGDDGNDEPVFASAPAHWLTIRIGREDPRSRADFFLDSTAEVALLLDRMLAHLGE